MIKIPSEVIFSVLKTLKVENPGDLYLENYLGHYQKYGDKFYDIYHFAWERCIECHPKSVLEIGVRTGISICQLMSAYIDYSVIERIVLCDLFNDGYVTPELVRINMRRVGIPIEIIDKTEFLIGDSCVVIPKFQMEHPDVKFDYILVDGSHEKLGAKQDLENVKPLVALDGVIVFDDIGLDGMDLKDVWEEFKTMYKDDFVWVENYNGKGIGIAVKK